MKAVFVGIVVLVLTSLAVVWIVDFRDAGRPGFGSTGVPHFQTATVRRVAMTDGPVISRGQDPMWVELESGTIPPNVTELYVVTDENCSPDEHGVSHCLNQVRYKVDGGWGFASLRHHHRMSEESCLAPGEIVEIAA